MMRQWLILGSLIVLTSAAVSATQITNVGWDSALGVMVVQFDTFPTWGGWRMIVNGTAVSMEGGAGSPVARPNAPLNQNPTGLLVGTDPWVSPLPANALPCSGALQFEIPGQGYTNVYNYDLSGTYCGSSTPLPAGSTVGGTIQHNTTWQGELLVTHSVYVPSGVTLTILPGTKVRFSPSRDYKQPGARLSMRVEGTLKAVGTAAEPIWFTSAAEDPMNGDWSMLRLVNASPSSEIRFAILEFAQQGLNLWNSSPAISDIIVRWNNWEGIYLESYCKPTIERARIYQNGYNGIAMEQYNDATIRHCQISESGTHGIHVDASTARVESCILEDNLASGLSVDNHGVLYVEGCLVQSNETGIRCGEGQNELYLDMNTTLVGNQQNTPQCASGQQFPLLSSVLATTSLSFPMADIRPYQLGYIPGNRRLDQFPYIYPDTDETRQVVNKIGDGLGLTWSVAWDGEAIWTATLWGDVYRLDPETGSILKQWKYNGPQAWGMAFDGEHLWINDFAEKRVYQLTTEGVVVSSFAIPDPTGGAKGITWDGEALCIMGWTSSTIYRVTQRGTEINRIQLQDGGGGITWDGTSFWTPGRLGIQRVSAVGEPLGSIYACSEGTWDLAWDGQYLWATQRTNENWFDEKLYRIRVLELLY